MLKDNNIKSTATNKIELLFQLFEAGILKREDIFPPKKNMLKHII